MGGKGGRPPGTGTRKSDGYTKPTPQISHTTQDQDAEELDREQVRVAIHNMLTDNLANLAVWLQQVGSEDPLKALGLFKDFAEFIIPKVQRTDGKIDGAAPIQINFESATEYDKRMQGVNDDKQYEIIPEPDEQKPPAKQVTKFSLDEILGNK